MNGVQKGALALAVAMSFTLPACAESRQNAVTEAAEQGTSEEAAVQEEPEQPEVVQEPVEASKPAELPPYEEVGSIGFGKVFEFDGTALNDAYAHAGTHYAFTCSYGDTEEQANMDMDYERYDEPITKGSKVHVQCRFVGLDYKGVPNFEVNWYRVDEQ